MLFGTNKMNDQLGKFGIQGGGVSNPSGMNPMCQMPSINPLMMHQVNPMCQIPSINPLMMAQMNPMYQMQPIGIMNPCMMPQINPFMMKGGNMPLTEEQKRQIKINGYLVGKQMALQMKQLKKQQEKVISPPIIQPDTGIISIQFKKGTSTINITMKSDEMVADLLNEYFVKSHTTNGKFNFNGNILLPTDVSSLSQVGLKNGSIIYVS